MHMFAYLHSGWFYKDPQDGFQEGVLRVLSWERGEEEGDQDQKFTVSIFN